MDSLTILIFIFVGLIVWIIFYYVAKAAVRNGIKEALAEKETRAFAGRSTPDKPSNVAQQRLQQQYEKGEISFEEFQTRWNKLTP